MTGKRNTAGAIIQANMEFNISMWSNGHRPLDAINCQSIFSKMPPLYGYRLDVPSAIRSEAMKRQRPKAA